MFKRACVLLAAGLMTAWGSAAWSQTDIRWATSAVGSAGHKALVALADLLNREMPKYRISVLPTPGAIVSVKGYATGQFDGYYGADIAFYQLAHDSKRFKGFKANMKRMPVQSFWTYTTEMGIGVRANELKNIKDWHDLNGKILFLGNPPWDTRAQLERAFEALGVKYEYRQVDLSSAGSVLARGGLDGICIYTTGGGVAVAPWVQEAGLAADWGVVNPSASELATLEKAGFAIMEAKRRGVPQGHPRRQGDPAAVLLRLSRRDGDPRGRTSTRCSRSSRSTPASWPRWTRASRRSRRTCPGSSAAA